MHGNARSAEQWLRDHLSSARSLLRKAGSQIRVSDLGPQDWPELNAIIRSCDDIARRFSEFTSRSRPRPTSNQVRSELSRDEALRAAPQGGGFGTGLPSVEGLRGSSRPVPIHSGNCSPALEGGYEAPPSGALKDSPAGEHYKQGGPEPLQLIETYNLPFHLGCVVKYVTRYNLKGGDEDLRKARWYLDRYLQLPRS